MSVAMTMPIPKRLDGLSDPTRRILNRVGILTWEELGNYSAEGLSSIKGLGRSRVAEIRTRLLQLGIHLHDESSPQPLPPRVDLPERIVNARARALMIAMSGGPGRGRRAGRPSVIRSVYPDHTLMMWREIVREGSGITTETLIDHTNLEGFTRGSLKRHIGPMKVGDLLTRMTGGVVAPAVLYLPSDRVYIDIRFKLTSWGFYGLLPGEHQVQEPRADRPIAAVLLDLSDEWAPGPARVVADWCEERLLDGTAAQLRAGPSSETRSEILKLLSCMGFSPRLAGWETWLVGADRGYPECSCVCLACSSDQPEVRTHCGLGQRETFGTCLPANLASMKRGDGDGEQWDMNGEPIGSPQDDARAEYRTTQAPQGPQGS